MLLLEFKEFSLQHDNCRATTLFLGQGIHLC